MGASLRAQNKAKNTIDVYRTAGLRFLAFLREAGMPTEVAKITREHVESFVAAVLEHSSPATAHSRYRALGQLFAWLVDEGEVTSSPLAKMHPPRVPEPVTPVIDDEDLRKLLKATNGTRFEDRRDAAILALFIDTGIRLAELTNLRLDDLDRDLKVAYVVGKGSRPRVAPFGDRTAQLLDRYIRMRNRTPGTTSPLCGSVRRAP